jgi:hypothetical protein
VSVMAFTVSHGRIVAVDSLADPARLDARDMPSARSVNFVPRSVPGCRMRAWQIVSWSNGPSEPLFAGSKEQTCASSSVTS